jgi:hypothetical protein
MIFVLPYDAKAPPENLLRQTGHFFESICVHVGAVHGSRCPAVDVDNTSFAILVLTSNPNAESSLPTIPAVRSP